MIPPGRRAQGYWFAVAVAVAAGATAVAMLARPGVIGPPAAAAPVVGLDTWLHVVDYAVLAALVAAALRASGLSRPAVRGGVAVGLYGTALELLQAALAYRTFAVGDLAANLAGVGIGIGLWLGVRAVWERSPGTE